MTAVGRDYGSEVSIYSIWNEPNHPAFLLPQWNSNGTPASPRIYRGLYQAGYAGLQAAGLAHANVLFGETAPTGYDKVNVRREGAKALLPRRRAARLPARSAVPELRSTGNRAPAASCRCPATPTTPTRCPPAPTTSTPERDNVTIGSLSRLSGALDLAAHAHAIPAHVPIYLTEFGVQSKPNKYLGVSAAKQAEFDAIAEHIAYNNPRVAAFSQYLLKDDPLGGPEPGASFQTGLEYVSGALKPLYFGWPVPLTVTKQVHGVALWGLVRPATGATKVTILVQGQGRQELQDAAARPRPTASATGASTPPIPASPGACAG